MLLPSFGSWKFGQRIELYVHRDIAGGGVEKFEELQFGIFEGRVRHVVNQRDVDALRARAKTVGRFRRARSRPLRPSRGNTAAVNNYRHGSPSERPERFHAAEFRMIMRMPPTPGR